MSKTSETKPRKKGFLAALSESIAMSSEGCGPACGCHVEEKNGEKGSAATDKNAKKAKE